MEARKGFALKLLVAIVKSNLILHFYNYYGLFLIFCYYICSKLRMYTACVVWYTCRYRISDYEKV